MPLKYNKTNNILKAKKRKVLEITNVRLNYDSLQITYR